MVKKITANSWAHWFTACLFGLSISYAYFSNWSSIQNSSKIIQWFLCLYLFSLFSLITYVGLFRWAKPRLTALNYSNRFQTLWLGGMLLSGIFLIWAIPVEAHQQIEYNLQIIATGEKNPEAQGSEVWLISVTGDKKSYDLSEFSKQGQWIFKDNLLVSTGPYPASLKIAIPEQNIKLVFVSHPWSGKANIIYHGENHLEDLYSAAGEERTISLEPGQIAHFQTFFRYLYLLSSGIAIGLVLFFISIWCLSTNFKLGKNFADTQKTSGARWLDLLYVAPAACVSLLYLLTFWPGVMTSDSTDQWGQMTTGLYNDWHPAFHTMTNWLITRMWLSPASVALAQIITLCVLIYWGINIQTRLGISKTGKILTSLCFAIPAIAVLIITLWKDIFYSLAVLALSFAILEIILSDGAWITRKRSLIALSLILSAVSLYRHNGMPIAIFAIAIPLVVFKKARKGIFISVLIFGCLYFIVRHPLYQYMGIATGANSNPGDTVLLHHIAAHLNANTYLTEEERSILSAIRPLDDKWEYDCSRIGSIIFSPKYHAEKLTEFSSQVKRISIDLFLRDPMVDINHQICVSSLVWRIHKLQNDFHSDFGITTTADGTYNSIFENTLGLKSDSLLPFFQHSLFKLLNSPRARLMWRSAIYLYLMLFATAIFCAKRRSAKYLYFLLPGFFQTSLLALASIAQDFRYQFSICLIGVFSIGLLFAFQSQKKDADPLSME